MDMDTWTKTIVRPLHDRGMTLSALAELNKINPTIMLGLRKRGHRKSEAALAKFLGVAVEKLFSDRYPLKRRRILSSKYADQLASQKARAAAGMGEAA